MANKEKGNNNNVETKAAETKKIITIELINNTTVNIAFEGLASLVDIFGMLKMAEIYFIEESITEEITTH